jgi:8-oxo-dGTP pyrophosphatase MutT (NUDIX family)
MGSCSLDVLARLSHDVPGALAARAEAWSDAARTPVEASPSASVILLRDHARGLQTYLLHRHARMPFAASMVVFPGGRVDPADVLAGTDAVRRCALRETREETDVDLTDEDLHDWAHWTTPEFEPRRYDTHFFVAALPGGQEARDVSGETDRAAWTPPRTALDEFLRHDIALMPPTLSILLELADVSNVAEVLELARERTIEPVLPRLVRQDDGWAFAYPVRP